jgi:hypothetical protein
VMLPHPKSDISDFGHSKVPNSGKPEFGRHGAYTILPTRKLRATRLCPPYRLKKRAMTA